MISSDYRAEARRKLSGKWKSAILILLANFLIFFAIGIIEGVLPESLSKIISLALCIIEIPLMFGMTILYVKLYNGEDVKAFDFLSLGFKNFKTSWSIFFQTIVKLILPFIAMIISYCMIIFGMIGFATAGITTLISTTTISFEAIASMGGVAIAGIILYVISSIWFAIESYYYKLAYIVGAENLDMSGKQIVEKSKELMTKRRWKLFCLEFSFIGWAILAVLTFGIGMLWLIPYVQFATIAFYKNALDGNSNTEVINEQ